MTTIYDIKKRAQQLSEKTDSETISPQEVGGLFSDIADYANDVDVNGSSLGIRKTYTSVSAMEADKNPVGDDGKPLKKGQLVNIYTIRMIHRLLIITKCSAGRTQAGRSARLLMPDMLPEKNLPS